MYHEIATSHLNLFFSVLACTTFCFSRTVMSESTREPIEYASIGVVNRNLGTVADTLGNFSLSIPPEFINDSIRISSIGYIAKTFAVREIAIMPGTILFSDNVLVLREVVVKPHMIKHKTAGRKGADGFIYIGDWQTLPFGAPIYIEYDSEE